MTPVDRFMWRTQPVVLPLKDEPGYDVAENRALMEKSETSDKDYVQAARRIVLADRCDVNCVLVARLPRRDNLARTACRGPMDGPGSWFLGWPFRERVIGLE
jgi:hypothetical protein